jgi:hypothetical protein
MIKALLRYIFFIIPSYLIRGLEFILFDKEQVVDLRLFTQDRVDKREEERRILLEHLENCRRQVYKKGKKSE